MVSLGILIETVAVVVGLLMMTGGGTLLLISVITNLLETSRPNYRTALALIEDGLAEQDWLDVAVGYVMLKELLDEARAEQASRN